MIYLKIFPEARKYCNGKESIIRYALAMAILELRPFYFSIQFALNILFELLNNLNEKELLAFNGVNIHQIDGRVRSAANDPR